MNGYAEKALEALESAYGVAPPYDSDTVAYIAGLLDAQVHATLAIAEELRLSREAQFICGHGNRGWCGWCMGDAVA